MQISILIVNYNVRYFLEHCLLSVCRAAEGLAVEILVVDNQSTDGSVALIQEKFPQVHCIANTENKGFAKANNQALALARGKYILYLNPDTILAEDTLQQCLQYMESNPDAGALGCRLIDGRGQFLPESKRGFPSARVAFYKISGLSALFPKSSVFNHYHLGHLAEFETNDIDVLVGCFMFCRKDVLDQVGGFDEDYFMYGEDIDLSYRIRQAGYRNIYYPHTTTIHFKGESTRKGSLNYVRMFYQAMIIFARKHLQSSQKRLYVSFIYIAIYLRAFLAFVVRFFARIRLPLLDTCWILGSLVIMKSVWMQQVKPGIHYPAMLLGIFFSAYTLIWLACIYLYGGYDKPYKSRPVVRGMFTGVLITLAIYGLLNESVRFSRGITVLGALGATLMILLSRNLLRLLIPAFREQESDEAVVLVANPVEEQEIKTLLKQAGVRKQVLGSISPFETHQADQLGAFPQLLPLCKLYRIQEIIFAQGSLSFRQIIDSIQLARGQRTFKIHAFGTSSIIGSNSKDTAGDLYTLDQHFNIAAVSSLRGKRVIDIAGAFIFLCLFPFLFPFVQKPQRFASHCISVLLGKKTFIGYHQPGLPRLKPFVLDVFPLMPDFVIPDENKHHLNHLYARDYQPIHDIQILWNKWRTL